MGVTGLVMGGGGREGGEAGGGGGGNAGGWSDPLITGAVFLLIADTGGGGVAISGVMTDVFAVIVDVGVVVCALVTRIAAHSFEGVDGVVVGVFEDVDAAADAAATTMSDEDVSSRVNVDGGVRVVIVVI